MTRTGVSDAELARTIGVRRQTIFRWKEGLVAHPRSAEEVLRCAAKLRLTPEERDRLLLAAGFPPEAPPALPANRASARHFRRDRRLNRPVRPNSPLPMPTRRSSRSRARRRRQGALTPTSVPTRSVTSALGDGGSLPR